MCVAGDGLKLLPGGFILNDRKLDPERVIVGNMQACDDIGAVRAQGQQWVKRRFQGRADVAAALTASEVASGVTAAFPLSIMPQFEPATRDLQDRLRLRRDIRLSQGKYRRQSQHGDENGENDPAHSSTPQERPTSQRLMIKNAETDQVGFCVHDDSGGIRTHDQVLKRHLRYHCATEPFETSF